MSENLSESWLMDDEVDEIEETVFGSGFKSDRIEGYGVVDAKITMAYKVKSGSSKAEAIKISFINKDEQTHTETIWVRGRDGKPYSVKNGKKIQSFGVNKIKSLLKVTGLFTDSKNVMASLYGDVETSDVTETNYGKEETNEQEVFNSLVGLKVKLCVSSKKVNATTSAEQDDSDEQAYVNQCIKDTKKFVIANPKKKSLKKFVDSKQSKEYPNVYKWFTETSIQHFCSLDGKFAGEMDKKDGTMLQDFIDANEEGFISDGRTLIAEELSDRELAKLGINKFGKRVEPEDDDGYDSEEEIEEDEAPKKSKAKPVEEDDDSDW